MKVLSVKKSSSPKTEVRNGFLRAFRDRGVDVQENQDSCFEFFSNLRYFNLPRTVRQKIKVQVNECERGSEIIASRDANRSLWMLRSVILLLIAAVSIPQLLGYSNDLLLTILILLLGYVFLHLLKSPEFSVESFSESLFEDVTRNEGITFEEVYVNQEAGVSNLLVPVIIVGLLVGFAFGTNGLSTVLFVTSGAVAPLFFRSFRSIFAFITIPYVILLYLLFIRFLGLFFEQIEATATTPNEAYIFLLCVNCFFVVFLGWLVRQYLRNIGQDHFTVQHNEKYKANQRLKALIGLVFAITHIYLWLYYIRFEWMLFHLPLPMALKALLGLTTSVSVVYLFLIFSENFRQIARFRKLREGSKAFPLFRVCSDSSVSGKASVSIPLLPFDRPVLVVSEGTSEKVLRHELAHIKLGHTNRLKWLNFASRWLLLGEGFFSLLFYKPSQIENEADAFNSDEKLPDLDNLPVFENEPKSSSSTLIRSLKYDYYQKWYLYHTRSNA